MPARDGTGPKGEGPLSGRGMGFCALNVGPHAPETTMGFAGTNGKPVAGSVENTNTEVSKMPGGDRTGPAGMGPMTGRAAGYCAGYSMPGFANAIPGRGFGFGRGRGFGFGRGLGLGFRGGRGGGGYWGAPYAAPAVPYPGAVAPYTAPYGAGPTPEQEADVLKGQAEYFEDALEGIKKRIAELEAKSNAKK